VIEDPTQAESRVAKDTVIVGKKDSPTSKGETLRPDLDDDSLLHSEEVSTCNRSRFMGKSQFYGKSLLP